MMRCFAKLNKKMCLEERQTEPNTSQASQKREAKLNSNSAWEMRQTKLDTIVQARIMAEPNTAVTRLQTAIISALNISLQANAELNSSPRESMVRKMMSERQRNPTKQCQATYMKLAELNNAATRQNYRMHCSPHAELNITWV